MSVNSKAAPVKFKNVTKIYGKDVLAVDNIDLEIEAGHQDQYLLVIKM